MEKELPKLRLDHLSVFLNEEPVDVRAMTEAVLGKVAEKSQLVLDDPENDEFLKSLRTDIVTFRSLLRACTDGERLPKDFRKAADRIGAWKDANPAKPNRKERLRGIAAETVEGMETDPEELLENVTFDPAVACYLRIEHARLRIFRALEKKSLSFEKFHDLRNKEFRRIFHIVKGVRLAREASGAVISDSFAELNASLKAVNQNLGSVYDLTLADGDGDHSDASIDRRHQRVAMEESLKTQIRDALENLHFSYAQPAIARGIEVENAPRHKIEIETKFLDVDGPALMRRLEQLGAEESYSGEIVATYFDYDDRTFRDRHRSWRLRHKVATGEVGMTSKLKMSDKNVRICAENEIDIGANGEMSGEEQYAQMQRLMQGLGLEPYRTVRKHRRSLQLDGISYDFDTLFTSDGRQLPMLLEIEADSEPDVEAAAATLGLRMKDAKPWSTRTVLKHYADAE